MFPLNDRSVDHQLVGRSINRSIGWSVDRSVDYSLSCWSVDWVRRSICWSTRSVDQSVDGSVGWSVGRSVGRSIKSVGRSVKSVGQIRRSVDRSVDRVGRSILYSRLLVGDFALHCRSRRDQNVVLVTPAKLIILHRLSGDCCTGYCRWLKFGSDLLPSFKQEYPLCRILDLPRAHHLKEVFLCAAWGELPAAHMEHLLQQFHGLCVHQKRSKLSPLSRHHCDDVVSPFALQWGWGTRSAVPSLEGRG